MLVGAVGASVVQAEEPSDCEPDQRTVPGNASSPCLWDYHLDEITAMRYVVEHSGNDTCHEALKFGPFNFARDFGANLYLLTAAARPDGSLIQRVIIRQRESMTPILPITGDIS